ncbi:ABC transporter ATP-binding protein [Pontibacillus chungwhensis BH030062]|uniref:ABC transporter ATP-binding protein n=1 Tax=Pontibacillus chungwhensis BH030062 TaxID=1385513 RepID=A0A0A2VDN9_9BACI|nr:ABC-F family ATP-binding cassette domain-containing protein [Pontibacillus chungwhensis]KGP91780.1 ABC transporter ATP-binding protein [Pontibacillus chungwhensis BH030062]
MLVTMKDIKKIVSGDLLFEEINFEIHEGDKVGLVGRNGTGKSTLFKLISGLEQADEGERFVRKQATIGYLEQLPDFNNGSVQEYLKESFTEVLALERRMTELETLMQQPEQLEKAMEEYGTLQDQYARLGGYELQAIIDKVAHGLGVEGLLNACFEHLSGGEQTKVGLARLLLQEPDVLLLDEPTNHLDLEAIEWLEEFIQGYTGAVWIISHDRTFLDHTVTKIMDLEQGELLLYEGNFSSFVTQKEEFLLAEFKAYQEQQKKIKKMKEAIKRLRQWANEANPPSEKLFRKAKSMEKALEKMEKKEKPLLDAKKMGFSLEANERSGNDVLVAEEVWKRYGDRNVLAGASLHLRFQDRLAIVGRNGSGKTTLLRLLMEQETPDEGCIKKGTGIRLGYLPQHPLKEVDGNLRMIDYFREQISVTEGQARHILAGFMFFGYAVFRKIGQLSGGEQMRVKLAIFMHQGVNLLVLDEPTNHLDIESQEVLEEALQDFNGTVLAVSHDRYFLNRCFSECAFLEDGKLYRYNRPFDEARVKHEENKVVKEPEKGHKKQKSLQEKEPEMPDFEGMIEALEVQLNSLTERMTDEEDIETLMELQQKKQVLESTIEEKYVEWLGE